MGIFSRMKIPDGMIFTLKELREHKGLTQRQVSKSLKITQGMYSNIENGTRRPNIDQLHSLAVLYGTSMDFIYHSFHRQKIVYVYPDASLRYGFRLSADTDIKLIQNLIIEK